VTRDVVGSYTATSIQKTALFLICLSHSEETTCGKEDAW